MLDARQKAEVSAIIERDLRVTLWDVVKHATPVEDEQIQIATGVVTLMLKDLYRQLGQAWLEAIIKAVLIETPVDPAKPH